MNSVSVSISVNLHDYCINFANLHIFSLIDMSDFEPYIYAKLSLIFF